MERIRVALVSVPRMLREIVEQAAAALDIEVEEITGVTTLRDALERTTARFLITSIDVTDDEEEVRWILESRPRMRVLAIARGGIETFLYELRPHKIPLGEMTARSLLGALTTKFPEVGEREA